MPERLWRLIEEVLVKEGTTKGTERLAKAVKRHPDSVARWIKTKNIPKPHDAFVLAKACGASESEATDIGKELLASATATKAS
jgi:malate synthase